MIGGFYNGLARNQGYVYFYAIPKNSMDEKLIDELINKQLKKSIQDDINVEKLEIEKKKYLFDSIYQMDGVLKPSEIIGEAITVGLKMKDIEKWNDNLEKVTVELIKDEMNKFLENKNYVIGGLKQ